MTAYLSLIGAPGWLTEIIKAATEPILVKWIITVSSWLQLSDFLLGNHAGQNVRPLFQQELEIPDHWVLVYSLAEISLVRLYGSQSDTTFEEDIDEEFDR